MAVIKIACPKCGQKVSGDDTFYGRSVNCPICTSKILFPENPAVPNQESLPSAPSAQLSFETTPPSQPAFETIQPTNQPDPIPPSQPGFETVNPTPPGMNPQAPSFDEAPVQASGAGMIPPVPQAPDIPFSDKNQDVPSPLLGAVSLVVGILNTVTACAGGPLLAPISIILGHAALAKAKTSSVKPAPGQSLAMIGVILGYAGLVFTIIGLIALLAFKEPMMEYFKEQG